MHDRFAHRRLRILYPSPEHKRVRGGRNPFEGRSYRIHKLTTKTRSPFFVPQGCGSEFSARFRMKNDPHAAAQAASRSGAARHPSRAAGAGLRRFPVTCARVRAPTPLRLVRQALRDSTKRPRQRERVCCGEAAAPERGVPRSTYPKTTTAGPRPTRRPRLRSGPGSAPRMTPGVNESTATSVGPPSR